MDPVVRPIMAGYDPQTLDRAPVRFGVAAARLTGAPLIVVTASATAPILDSLPQQYTTEAPGFLGADCFADLASDLDAEDVRIQYREIRGSSATRVLYEAADEHDARLLVIGSTARGPVGRVLPGSTAERLMHAAPCAVAVVPRDWTGEAFATIGVAYAETDEGFEALCGAYALAERADATLRVLSVAGGRLADYRDVTPGNRYESGRTLVDVEGDHQRVLETAMRDAVARLPGLASDVVVGFDAFSGEPAETLIGVSAHLDLLVCGSRGYGPLRAALLGGVSHKVISAASCPVIVLARGDEAPFKAVTHTALAQDSA